MTDTTALDDGISAARVINEAHGTKIETAHNIRMVGDALRNQISQEAGQINSHIVKAGRQAQERISKAIGKVQGHVDGAIEDAGNGIRNSISNVVSHMVDFGIELPSERQIQEIQRQQITQQTSQSQVTPTGTCSTPATCQVHLLDESIRPGYDTLGLRPGGAYLVYPHGPLVCEGEPLPQVVRVFRHWWQAELTCRLLSECRFPISRIIPYWRAIDDVQLASGELGPWMGPLCMNFFAAADAYMAYLLHSTPESARFPGELPDQGSTLPDGYCWWCDPEGGKHIYPCEPETVPDSWKRC